MIASNPDGAHTVPRLVDVARASRARENMPPTADIVDLADVFHLLGAANRVRVLIALTDGRMAVRDIAAVVGLSESATSHALRLLRAHRIVEVERVGCVAYYALADSHVRELLQLALEHIGHTVLLHPAGPGNHSAELDDNCRPRHETDNP